MGKTQKKELFDDSGGGGASPQIFYRTKAQAPPSSNFWYVRIQRPASLSPAAVKKNGTGTVPVPENFIALKLWHPPLQSVDTQGFSILRLCPPLR
ncbi:hypothetical protein AS29_010195 [Bacillus sp. SJS]|nr:hypothetical protein AS29_010195 [Bacillus sp. SJS]